MRRATTLSAALVACVGLVVAGCSSGDYADTQVPAAARTSSAPAAAPKPATSCGNPVASYAPDGALPSPSALPPGSTMDRIRQRGRLIAGVSADSLQLGARNPVTGAIEGFDIDMLHAVSQAIFGDPDKIEFRVISTADRLPVLEKGQVDIVARAMTINCERWQQIAFSSEYYRAGQKVLVPLGSKATGLESLGGKRVCAPTGSTSLDALRRYPSVVPVPAGTHTGCLVLFQQGKADAITGDDTVLAGLAAQDPYASVVRMKAFTTEPYGLGIPQGERDFVQFVNGVLDKMRTDGRWKASYDRWLKDLGPAPAPPKAVYGRTP
ncbi:glutamate ABC transporter substrate-binding protein [Luteipulveratus flavus]|uniref:Glutamate ABC transporter substrate-binding protein n=1 Tax=Luteipulveratus flavus TaxID=3031728 RepID=A0ABT6C8W3_9MICO|nr:glutamate ABC transporter substrate-binding protein [Luteipulveratus sp. YIM 133296]MDF8264474.1 glutamate ABC transporter substrate-binding protein [Luteipulveratus sp. YIM 133296]